MREFGFTNPILVDGSNEIIAGHGRLMAAKQLGMDEVPTITLDHLTDDQKRAYVLADNKLALNAGWNEQLLAIELEGLADSGFDVGLTGFSDEEVSALIATLVEPTDGLTDEDAVPEPPEEPATVLGDIWLMGDHRLMCGDSTDVLSVEDLMSDSVADMVFTDPPYGMFLDTNYDQMFSSDSSHRETGDRFDRVKGDHDDFDAQFINTIFSVFHDCKEVFLWGADYYSDLVPNKNDGSWVVWDKRCHENMDRVVGNTFELCWSRAKHKRMVARILWSGHHGMQRDDTKKRVHPTQKPVELVEWFFDYYSLKDKKVVVDLFGGSGTTLIACEKTSRTARLMELGEKYCDVIVTRWQDYTGKQATLESTGQTFAEVKSERE